MLKLKGRRRRPSVTLTKVGLHCKFVQSLDMTHINADQQFGYFFPKGHQSGGTGICFLS